MKDFNDKRQFVSLLMKQAGWVGYGTKKPLAKKLGIYEKSLIMALNGYRETPRSYQILEMVETFLMDKGNWING